MVRLLSVTVMKSLREILILMSSLRLRSAIGTMVSVVLHSDPARGLLAAEAESAVRVALARPLRLQKLKLRRGSGLSRCSRRSLLTSAEPSRRCLPRAEHEFLGHSLPGSRAGSVRGRSPARPRPNPPATALVVPLRGPCRLEPDKLKRQTGTRPQQPEGV